MKIKLHINKTFVNTFFKVSLLTGLVLANFSGIAIESKEEVTPYIELDHDYDLSPIDIVNEENAFTSLENIRTMKWYVVKYTNGDMTMTRKSTINSFGVNKTKYYYVDAFQGGTVLGEVLYSRTDENKYQIYQGEDIESAISVYDYIISHDVDGNLYREYYSREDMEKLNTIIQEDYEKKIVEKEKVLIKEPNLN